VDNQSW